MWMNHPTCKILHVMKSAYVFHVWVVLFFNVFVQLRESGSKA